MGRSRFRRSYIELGKDGAGQDLIAHGDTSGAYLWWDASANKLKFMGGADMDFGSFATPLVVNQTNNYPLGIFGEISVAQAAGAGSTVQRGFWSRLKVSASQESPASEFGAQLQFRWASGATILGSGTENAQYGGAWLYLEQDTAGQELANYAHASGAVIQVETWGALTIPATAHLSGLKIESRLGAANGAAISLNSGTIAGLFITKSPAASGVTAQNWPYGIFIEDCDIGIHLESTQKIQFLDAGIFIHASVDGKLLISSDGGGADDITLSGGITLDANLTTPGKIILTRTDPTAAENGIYSVVNAGGSTGWTNSVAATRSRIYVTNTGVNIGNAYGGWFGVQFSTGMTASPAGLTCGIYAEAASEIAFTTPSSVAYFQSVSSSNGNQSGMPILVLTSIGGSGDKPIYAIEFGYSPAATTVGAGAGEMYYNETIAVKVNGNARFLPLSSVEGTYTTAYPIVSTHGGGDATANAFTSTITDPTIDGAGETSYGFSGTINAGGVTGWSGGQVCPVFGQLNIDARSPGDYGTGAGGWFELTYAATLTADGIGLTAGAYVKVSSACALKAPTAVLYLEDENTDSGDTSTMPILVLASKGTEGQKSKVAIAFGFVPAGAQVGNDSGMIYYNNTIRVTANGDVRFIPLSNIEGTLTRGADGTDGHEVAFYGAASGELFKWNSAAGTLDITSPMTAADNVVDITVTDATTLDAGRGRALYLKYTVSGSKTGTFAVRTAAIDTFISDACPEVTGLDMYMGNIDDKAMNNVFGIAMYCEDIGSAVSGSWIGIDMGRVIENQAAGRDTFMRFKSHAATTRAKSIFYLEGSNSKLAGQFFMFSGAGEGDSDWVDTVRDLSSGHTQVGVLRVGKEAVVGGGVTTQYYIPLYTAD